MYIPDGLDNAENREVRRSAVLSRCGYFVPRDPGPFTLSASPCNPNKYCISREYLFSSNYLLSYVRNVREIARSAFARRVAFSGKGLRAIFGWSAFRMLNPIFFSFSFLPLPLPNGHKNSRAFARVSYFRNVSRARFYLRHNANSAFVFDLWCAFQRTREPGVFPGGSPNFNSARLSGASERANARHLSSSAASTSGSAWNNSWRISTSLSAAFSRCTDFSSISRPAQTIHFAKERPRERERKKGILIDVPQIHSSRVNSEFYFGNSSLIRPSIFDDCTMFVSCSITDSH